MEVTKQNRELFLRVRFLTAALDRKEELYDYKATLKVEQDRAIATDGHRLHSTGGLIGIEPGCYKVPSRTQNRITLEPVEEIRFPHLDSVLPDTEGWPSFHVYVEPYPSGGGLAEVYTTLVRNCQERLTFDPNYVKDALLGCMDECRYDSDTSLGGAVLTGSDYYALIMPRRMND